MSLVDRLRDAGDALVRANTVDDSLERGAELLRVAHERVLSGTWTVVDEDGDDPMTAYGMGVVCVQRGDLRGAAMCFHQAARSGFRDARERLDDVLGLLHPPAFTQARHPIAVAAVKGMTPVSTLSVDATERELAKLIVEARGGESTHDPAIGLAARDLAELAHASGAGLVAVVEHPMADPAVLVGVVVTSDTPLGPEAADALRHSLEVALDPDIREIAEARTDRGYPVVITERIPVNNPTSIDPLAGCQLQAVVFAPEGHTKVILTLHSLTGIGWLELATVLGQLVSTVELKGTLADASGD